ncbi:MAG: DUF2520 domain-containing protein [Deltaproteobacteria bacterium]|nr:MAG: DUF2520 domain-containing protein [Deltaproteobacteria bacterium]
MQITIVGPGRLGRTIAPLIRARGWSASLIGRGDPVPSCDVIWLTIPDLALAEVIPSMPRDPVLLHASGATGLEVFCGRPRSGSLHPLMTFPGPEVATPELQGVPAAIAGDPDAKGAARALASHLGLNPIDVPGDRRLYHAAAVIAGNGATILLSQACQLLSAAGVPADRAADTLIPLMLRSVRNATPDPIRALTGPMARGEQQVIEDHVTSMEAAGLHDIAKLHRALAEAAERALRHRRDEK